MLDLQSLFNSSQDIGFLTDARGSILGVTRGTEELLGHPNSDVSGRRFGDLVEGDELGPFFAPNGPPSSRMHLALRLRDRTGRLVAVDAAAFPLVLAGGEHAGWFIAGQIADRAQAVARGSQEMLRALFEKAGEAMLVVDVESRRVVDVNAKACELYGYEREEFLRLKVPDLRPPDPAHQKAINRALDVTGNWGSDEDMHVRKDGTLFSCEISIRRVLIGDRLYSISIFRDVSERRRAAEYFRALFEKANHGILMFELSSFRVMAANEKASEMLGYTREDLMGMPVLQLHPEFDHVPARRAAAQVEASGEGAFTNLWYLRKDGSVFPIETGMRIITLGERRYFLSVFQDITQRLQMMSSLEEARTFLEKLREEAGDAIFILDDKGRYIYVNPRGCELTGRTRQDLLGATLGLITSPDRLAFHRSIFQRVLAGESVRFRTEALRPDGGRVPVELNAFPISVGERRYVSAFVRDMTEQDAAEHALRESEARWRSLVMNAPDIIMTVDREGRILFINRTVEGYTQEGVQGTTLFDYVSPEHHGLVREALQKVFEKGEPFRYELAGAGPGGSPAWYSSRLSPILREGRVDSAILVSTDITERRRDEEEMRRQKAQLESQGEAAIDGILMVSAEGRMLSFNRRFIEMWAIPEEVVKSRSDEQALQSVLHKLVLPDEFLARVRYLYAHRDEVSREEIGLKDGRVFDRYSSPVTGQDGTHYGRVWYFRDVTGRKRSEEQLRQAAEETRRAYEDLKRAQAQLIRTEKLASIGMLVSGVAHEINNPLNVIYGNLKLMADGRKKPGPATARRMIRDALRAAEHARGIIEDFRNFARDTRTAELVDLNACLKEALALLRRQMGTRLRVVQRLGRLPGVRCFRSQMGQVFLNLIKNGAEAIEERGTLTIRSFRKDRSVVVEVRDTGRGMTEEVRKRIFEPFFTTKEVGQGMGLGLSISATIVQNHGGQITVKSRLGRGTLFRVSLPLAKA